MVAPGHQALSRNTMLCLEESKVSNTSRMAQCVPSLPHGGGAIQGPSLDYSSGHGNGPFGLGWQLSVPRITRKTEKGLPRYDDTDGFVMLRGSSIRPQSLGRRRSDVGGWIHTRSRWLKKKAISTAAVSGASDPWMALRSMFSP